MKEDQILVITKTKAQQHKPHQRQQHYSSHRHRLMMTCLILSLSSIYLLYTLNLLYSHHPCPSPPPHDHTLPSSPTTLDHIVFAIAASAKLYSSRRHYISLWHQPNRTRTVVWLDLPVKRNSSSSDDPPTRLSGDTRSFPYTHPRGHRSAIRISRVLSETLDMHRGINAPRWFVMGDDDTVFLPDNVVSVLSKFDHTQPYYVGSQSESHLQNIFFSYGMAYGGGGFAVSYPLAVAVRRIQDRCIRRYPGLYGSDDRMQACMAELGVPLTKHVGFHQFDVYGSLFGLLAAHPVAPLISLHHLDVVASVLPGVTQVEALGRIFAGPVQHDSAAVMQQSICYEKKRNWTVSVSWGYAVQIIAAVVSPREMEMPMRTFLNWYQRADYTAYAFNTRPVARIPCLRPFVSYLNSTRFDRSRNLTVTVYGPGQLLSGGGSKGECRWKKTDPLAVERVIVQKRPDPLLWDRAPRRNCCRVVKTEENRKKGKKSMVMTIDVGVCRDGEISEM